LLKLFCEKLLELLVRCPLERDFKVTWLYIPCYFSFVAVQVLDLVRKDILFDVDDAAHVLSS